LLGQETAQKDFNWLILLVRLSKNPLAFMVKTLKRLLKADALILGGLAIYAIYSGINQAGSNSNGFPHDPSRSGFDFDVTDAAFLMMKVQQEKLLWPCGLILMSVILSFLEKIRILE